MSRKKKLEHVSSIPKDDAQRIMSQKGYPCRVVDGILTFEDDFGTKDIMALANTLMKIGYNASWAARRKVKSVTTEKGAIHNGR